MNDTPRNARRVLRPPGSPGTPISSNTFGRSASALLRFLSRDIAKTCHPHDGARRPSSAIDGIDLRRSKRSAPPSSISTCHSRNPLGQTACPDVHFPGWTILLLYRMLTLRYTIFMRHVSSGKGVTQKRVLCLALAVSLFGTATEQAAVPDCG